MEQFYELQACKPTSRTAPGMPRYWVVENIVFIDAWFKAHQLKQGKQNENQR